jgi:hypothetical protein
MLRRYLLSCIVVAGLLSGNAQAQTPNVSFALTVQSSAVSASAPLAIAVQVVNSSGTTFTFHPTFSLQIAGPTTTTYITVYAQTPARTVVSKPKSSAYVLGSSASYVPVETFSSYAAGQYIVSYCEYLPIGYMCSNGVKVTVQ